MKNLNSFTRRPLLTLLTASILWVAFENTGRTAIIGYTEVANVGSEGVSVAFSQFNPALGTLTGIDLILNSSTAAGSATVTNNSATNNVTVRYIQTAFSLDPAAGFTGYDGSTVNLNTTPTAKLPASFVLAKSTSQVFSVNAGQSLIGGSAQAFSIDSGSFASYIGGGNVVFFALATINLNTIGSTYTVNSSAYYATTSLTLNYTYTSNPSPAPEPGQVAASLVLLAGVAGVGFFRYRRVTRKA
jgi:hypothetical protein